MKFADFKKLRIQNNYVCHLAPDYDSIDKDFKACRPRVKDTNCIKCFHNANKRKII